jgi:hypothetical protein
LFPASPGPRAAIRAAPRQVAALLSAMALLFVFAAAATTREHDAARTFLAAAFEVTDAEFARIAGGQVVSRTLGVSDRREVATLGIVRMRITPEFYVERLSDIGNFKRDEAVLQIGTFSTPPDLRDVSRLTLDDSDVLSLRTCDVGKCGVQLSARAISRFRQEVDWRRADAEDQANALIRRILVEYVTDYLNAGMAASMRYADEAQPLDLRHEFVSLMDRESGAWREVPVLHRHLFDYPESRAEQTTDLVYWSKEKMGRRAVTSVTHLAISRTAGASPADYAVASRHIYGTHYFDASLGLTVLVRDRSSPTPATYIAYMNRSRVDVFGSPFGGVARRIVSSKARATVSHQLARLQRGLEGQFAAPGSQ